MQQISISKIYSLATEPTNKILDRFWFNTTNKQLYRCDGTNWVPVKISSNDVVVNTSGTTQSLTTFLNSQISNLVEGIDSKQDNLNYYSEDTNANTSTLSAKYTQIGRATSDGDPIVSRCLGFRMASNFQNNGDGTYSIAVSNLTTEQEITYTTLSATSYTTAHNTSSAILSGYAVGDILSINNSSKYYDVFTITAISGNGITFTSNKPAANVLKKDTPSFNEYVIYCLAKPNIGYVDVTSISLATGIGTQSLGLASTATGAATQAFGNYGFATGSNTKAGYAAFSSGKNTKALGEQSFASGSNTIASANNSFASGNNTKANGGSSHAEGTGTETSGDSAHAEGGYSKATANYAHAEGSSTVASGVCSHAEGQNSQASAMNAHAEGYNCKAQNYCSHAEGIETIANANGQHVGGGYNAADASKAFIIGNGKNDSNRNNALTVGWNGDLAIDGKLIIGDTSGNPTGVITAVDTSVSAKNTNSTVPSTKAVYTSITNAKADIDNILSTKANLSGGNTFTGQQFFPTTSNEGGVVISQYDTNTPRIQVGTSTNGYIDIRNDVIEIAGPYGVMNINGGSIKYNNDIIYTQNTVEGSLSALYDNKVEKSTTINNKPLSTNIALRAADIAYLDSQTVAQAINSTAAVANNALVKSNNLSDLTNKSTARSNLSVYSKSEVNAISAQIKSDITGVYIFKGSDTYANILTKQNPRVGDVWNSTTANGYYPTGTNYAWNGTSWDALGGEFNTDNLAKLNADNTFTGNNHISGVLTLGDDADFPYITLDPYDTQHQIYSTHDLHIYGSNTSINGGTVTVQSDGQSKITVDNSIIINGYNGIKLANNSSSDFGIHIKNDNPTIVGYSVILCGDSISFDTDYINGKGVDVSAFDVDNNHIPTSKLVKTELDKKQDKLNWVLNGNTLGYVEFQEHVDFLGSSTVNSYTDLIIHGRAGIVLGDFKISGIDHTSLSNGSAIVPTSNVVKTYVDNNTLKKTSNLSDLSNKSTARTNLQVYSKTEVDNKVNVKANTSDVVLNSEIDTTIPSSPSDSRVPSTKLATTIADAKADKVDTYTKSEINTLLGALNLSPVTGKFTGASANTLVKLNDSTSYAGKPGKILINPNINNTGAVYIQEGSSDITTAFPLYPDQITEIPFANLSVLYVGTEVANESFNYILSFGNSLITTTIESSLLFTSPIAGSTGTVEVKALRTSDGTLTLESELVAAYAYNSSKVNDNIPMIVYDSNGIATNEIADLKVDMNETVPVFAVDSSTSTTGAPYIVLALHDSNGNLTNSTAQIKVIKTTDGIYTVEVI